MQEAKIGRIVIPGQPGQIGCETSSLKKKVSAVVCICYPSHSRELKIGGP
jgi:hypothetical protein